MLTRLGIDWNEVAHNIGKNLTNSELKGVNVGVEALDGLSNTPPELLTLISEDLLLVHGWLAH